MKTSRPTLVLLACMACTDNVGVVDSGAKTDGNALTRLQASLVPDCQKFCQTLSSCPSSGVTFAKCFGSCLTELGSRFLNHSEVCAAAGEAVLECFNGLDCAALTQSTASDALCGFAQAKAQCPIQEDSYTENAVPQAGPVAAAGGSPAVGGAGGTTSTSGTTMGFAGVSSVVCQGSGADAIGGIPDASPDGYREQCDATVDNCSDAHVYRLTCNTSLEDRVDCYCIRDGLLQATFQDPALLQDTSAAACNNLDAANARCGWSLVAPTDASTTAL